MELIGITSISVTKLQSRLAQTLRWASRQKQMILVNHWYQPTHVIIPISYLPREVTELLTRLPETPMEDTGTGEKVSSHPLCGRPEVLAC